MKIIYKNVINKYIKQFKRPTINLNVYPNPAIKFIFKSIIARFGEPILSMCCINYIYNFIDKMCNI